MAERSWKLLDLLSEASSFFSSKDIENPRLQAELLLAASLGVQRLDLYLQFDRLLTADEVAAFRHLVRQRLKGVPVQYVTGEAAFRLLELAVSPEVLIPRPETEILVEVALSRLDGAARPRVLDLGCGEGGYARELTRRGAEVVAIDCAAYSIEYAKKKSLSEGVDVQHHIRNSNDLYGIESSSFDTVLCSMMLMDCEDLDGTMKEISRVLKPDGQLYASVLHPCFTGKKIGRQGKGIDRKVVARANHSIYYCQWTAIPMKDRILNSTFLE